MTKQSGRDVVDDEYAQHRKEKGHCRQCISVIGLVPGDDMSLATQLFHKCERRLTRNANTLADTCTSPW